MLHKAQFCLSWGFHMHQAIAQRIYLTGVVQQCILVNMNYNRLLHNHSHDYDTSLKFRHRLMKREHQDFELFECSTLVLKLYSIWSSRTMMTSDKFVVGNKCLDSKSHSLCRIFFWLFVDSWGSRRSMSFQAPYVECCYLSAHAKLKENSKFATCKRWP